MEYVRGVWNGFWGYLIPGQPQGVQPRVVQPGTGEFEGSESGEEDMPPVVPLPNAPTSNHPIGITAATNRSGDRRGLLPGSTMGGLSPGPAQNGSRQGTPASPKSNPRSRWRPSPKFTNPLHYYEKVEQALEAHEQRMKRRLEERHDREFVKRRKLAPFAKPPPNPSEFTVEKEQYDYWRDRDDRARLGQQNREGPSAQPVQSSPQIPGAAGNVGGDSRVDIQRNQRVELFRLSMNAQPNRRPSHSPAGSPAGDDKNRDRSSSALAPGPGSPRISSRGPSRQQEESGVDEGPSSSQTPLKSPPPKPASPKQRNAKPAQTRQQRELEKLKIDGSAKFFGVNYTQFTDEDPPTGPGVPGSRRSLSPSPPPQTGSKPVASPPKTKAARKKRSLPRGPENPRRTLQVDVTEETRDVLTELADLNYGEENTSGKGLYCLCYAIHQSMLAQYPDEDVPDVKELPGIINASMDEDEINVMNMSKDVRREGRNFTSDEAHKVILSMGYNLVTVEEGEQGPYILDNNGYIKPGDEKYLILHHRGNHWQSVGRKSDRALRVGKTRTEKLAVTRRKQFRHVIGNMIHDPVFDTGATIEQLYVTINENLPRRLKVPFKQSEIRNGLIWFDEKEPENSLTQYDPAGEAARRRAMVPAKCKGRGCVCGLIITPARFAHFRAALAEIIHTPGFDHGEDVDTIRTFVNSFWQDANNIPEFDDEETRAGLIELSLDVDLVDYDSDDNVAKRTGGVPPKCAGRACPCGSRRAIDGSPARSRRDSSTTPGKHSRRRPSEEQQQQQSPKRAKSNSPGLSAEPEVRISAERLEVYRKALTAIMEHAEHRPKYFNPGVKDARVLVRLNAHLSGQAVGQYGRHAHFSQAENQAALSALDAEGGLIRYPVGEDLVQRLRSRESVVPPPRKDYAIQKNQIDGALANTFGAHPSTTRTPRSPSQKATSPPPSRRPPRNSSNPHDNTEHGTLAPKLLDSGKKRKSAERPYPSASPSKRQKSPPLPPPTDTDGGRAEHQKALRQRPEQQRQTPAGSSSRPGATKSGKKRSPWDSFYKKLEDKANKK